jgi:release factor glutamine methyltransferase
MYTPQSLPAGVTSRFCRLAARARTGVPVQYLVHSAPFFDLDLYVDRRVLVPRPETEELVSRALARIRSGCKLQAASCKLSVVDYGTGSGCIAIALARAFPAAKVVAVDASKAALAVAGLNIRKQRLSRRIRLVCASSLDAPALRRLECKCDLLISNPPYVPTARLSRLSVQVRHEPKLALDGGPKGTNIVAMLLQDGPRLLKPGGLLAVEIDWSHGRLARRLAARAEIERDLAGRTRYVFLQRSA